METTTESKSPQSQEKNPETISSQLSKEKASNDNTVYVGSKHLMNYVSSIEMQLNNSNEVVLKSRGKFISKAVDIAEIAKRQIQNNNLKIKHIQIGTEEYDKDGKKIKVSTIEIILTK